jgi:nitrogen fixation-related uncharacterized protein
MSARQIILVVMAICAVALLVVEFYGLWSGQQDATITDLTREAIRKYPVIALAIGVLLGHLFWWQGEAP